MNSNMSAELWIDQRYILDERSFVEIVVWRVPVRVPGSQHHFKYRLAYVVDGQRVLLYDNERGKGDHKHVGGVEEPYIFTDSNKLLDDFFADVDRLRREK